MLQYIFNAISYEIMKISSRNISLIQRIKEKELKKTKFVIEKSLNGLY